MSFWLFFSWSQLRILRKKLRIASFQRFYFSELQNFLQNSDAFFCLNFRLVMQFWEKNNYWKFISCSSDFTSLNFEFISRNTKKKKVRSASLLKNCISGRNHTFFWSELKWSFFCSICLHEIMHICVCGPQRVCQDVNMVQNCCKTRQTTVPCLSLRETIRV